MHGSWVGWDKVDRVMLTPRVGPGPVDRYLIRIQPGEIDRVMTAVDVALRKRDPNRVVGEMKKMSDYKRQSYAGDSLMAVTLSVVTGLVLIFSALGIFGLATFNVNSRTRQIGTRRAIGARKRDIVRYFMVENWMVTTAGVLVGCGLALGGFLALQPVPDAAPRPLLPRGRRAGPVGGRSIRRVAALVARCEGLAGHGHAQRLADVAANMSVACNPAARPKRLTHDFSDFPCRGPPGKPDCIGRGRQ